MANEEIPVDADHWLFAEDLTNFVFRHQAGFPLNQIREECQNLVHEGFSEIIRSAVAVIENNLTEETEAMFSEMSLKTDVIEEYKNYASNLKKSFSSSVFDANKFLHYCVHITCLGERFYRTGMEEFHYLAFASVREALERYDMLNGGWNTLDLVADKITSVEGHFSNLPSPEHEAANYEQSVLNANVEPEHVNRTWNILNEHSNSSSKVSTSGSSSDVKDNAFSDYEESIQSLDIDGYPQICKELDAFSEANSESMSPNDSSPEYLVSHRKVPTLLPLNSISSSSISEFHAETDNSFLGDGIYREQNVTNSPYVFQHFPDKGSLKPLDLFVSSDQNETPGIFQLNESSSERFSPFHAAQKCDENSRTASKEVVIPSEHSKEIESPHRVNRNSQHLFRPHNSDQSLKIRSTAKKTARNRGFSLDAHASNSTGHKSGTRSVFLRSDRNGTIAKCTPVSLVTDLGVTKSK